MTTATLNFDAMTIEELIAKEAEIWNRLGRSEPTLEERSTNPETAALFELRKVVRATLLSRPAEDIIDVAVAMGKMKLAERQGYKAEPGADA